MNMLDKNTVSVYSLINRVLPGYKEQINVYLDDNNSNQDYYEISGEEGSIIIRGNSPISIATGLNRYLKYDCNVHLSWCGSQKELPSILPKPTVYNRVISQQHRVYFNYCTFNYSASWWQWNRWEQEIDFMALNGINMPLSVVGLEGVWYNTLLRLNFTDEEARCFLVGPAYLAWQYMTNLEGEEAPLPMNWIKKRIELGQKIIKRQLELGMQPILQGFSGYVPSRIVKKFPSASVQHQESWLNFKGVCQLDPLDPIFSKIATVFLEEQEKLFGKLHYYATDPFHESAPPQEDSKYLHNVGKSIIDSLTTYDSKATWVMQAWSLRKDIVTAVPKDRLLILDLNGEKYKSTDGYWGYNFVVGNLHNFGGRINLHGDMQLLANNQFVEARKTSPSACGTGLFMEGINQNPVYYDLAFELLTSTDIIDLDDWVEKYILRRYGNTSSDLINAWKIILKTAYKEKTNGVENSSIICARPAVDCKKSGPNAGFHIPYNNIDLFNALMYLLESSDIIDSDAYHYDMVDILRQVLSNYGQSVHQNVATAFKTKDIDGFNKYSSEFLELLLDVDRLLCTRAEFSLENWIKSARELGDTDYEKDLYEYNASMLVTIWGPIDNPAIFDYGWREWSGLIKQYYYMRWHEFNTMLSQHLDNGTDYNEDDLDLTYGREVFRANSFYNSLADKEIEWVRSKKTFNTATESELEVAKELILKYKERIANDANNSLDTLAYNAKWY